MRPQHQAQQQQLLVPHQQPLAVHLAPPLPLHLAGQQGWRRLLCPVWLARLVA
jgi:hypothetical protein